MKIIQFPTGNIYTGDYIKKINTMEGFGTYNFADGSEYRGYFKDGLFDGYGRIKIVNPERFIFYGYFVAGDLIRIDSMHFSDGLRIYCEFVNDKFTARHWDYCTAIDRRFSSEFHAGLKAYDQTIMVCDMTERPLPPKSYDAEVGIYNANTGFMTKVLKPFSSSYFIASKTEKKWIEEHCRFGKPEKMKDIPRLPTQKFRNKIIASNFKLLYKMFPEYFCTYHEQNCKDFNLNYINLPKASDPVQSSTITTTKTKNKVNFHIPVPQLKSIDSNESICNDRSSSSTACDSISMSGLSVEENVEFNCKEAVRSLRYIPYDLSDEDSEQNLMKEKQYSKRYSISA